MERYGRKVGDLLEGWVASWPSNASRWWKDLVSLSKGDEEDWFNELERRVGNGSSTSFWKVAWRGEVPFMIKYHRLFSISINQEATVQDLCIPISMGGGWAFNWRRRLFVWVNALLTELLGELEGFVASSDEDRWKWRLEDDQARS